MEENFERFSCPLTTDGFTFLYVDFFRMQLNFPSSVTGNTTQRVWRMVTEYTMRKTASYNCVDADSQIDVTLTSKLGVC